VRRPQLLAQADPRFEAVPTCADDACFWLYSSGSTGAPRAVVHAHASLVQTAQLYGRPILGITEDDVVFSAAKLSFAYGLGNGLTFPPDKRDVLLDASCSVQISALVRVHR